MLERSTSNVSADFSLVVDINVDLQELRALTSFIIAALIHSTPLLPYTVRMLAREAFLALRVSCNTLAQD